MSDECIHEWELGQITSDKYNTINVTQYAYYYSTKCLATVRKIDTTQQPTQPEKLQVEVRNPVNNII